MGYGYNSLPLKYPDYIFNLFYPIQPNFYIFNQVFTSLDITQEDRLPCNLECLLCSSLKLILFNIFWETDLIPSHRLIYYLQFILQHDFCKSLYISQIIKLSATAGKMMDGKMPAKILLEEFGMQKQNCWLDAQSLKYQGRLFIQILVSLFKNPFSSNTSIIKSLKIMIAIQSTPHPPHPKPPHTQTSLLFFG